MPSLAPQGEENRLAEARPCARSAPSPPLPPPTAWS